MDFKIVEYGLLSECQKKEAVELFIDGFGHMMTFSKNIELKRKLFFDIFHPTLFKCYVEDNRVWGLIGVATSNARPIDFKPEICKKYFKKIKGTIISKQMNAIFQKPVVKAEDELYIDVLVTSKDLRRKGVGTELLKYAFDLNGYNSYYLHVFSKNKPALNLYHKLGFKKVKEERFSFLRFLKQGYPIQMRK